jgi:Tol biopolymer transport system component/tRNA A-37 threonylcarbamoyl transferase component Bud32
VKPAFSADRWQRVKELLNGALELEPDQRAAYLDEQCAGDTSLRDELSSLLSSYDEAGDFMDGPREERRDPTPTAGDDLVVGMRIGPYRVIEEVGHGGMGSVYRAIRDDDAFKKQVAIKVIRRGMNHGFIHRRFRHERQILATLEHHNVARLLDGGTTDDGLPYFVMEYIVGRPIDEYCDRNHLTTRQRLDLFRQVCSAVEAAHERRIIHRDIKPGNILITVHGQPKLLDFGIAKILDPELSTQTMDPTATVMRLMTPEYASPEQIRGDEVTPATDVYSLGVLLYELLTGHKPYRLKSRSPHEIAHVICDVAPERPSTIINKTEVVTHGENPPVTVSPETVSEARSTRLDELRRTLCGDLDNIVLMAMRKEASRRYVSVADLSEDIRRYLDGHPVKARKDTVFYRFSKKLKRNRTTITAAAIALLLGTTTVVLWRDYLQPLVETSGPPPTIIPFTSFPGDETQPAFSPDGEAIAFVWGGENHENNDIYVKRVAGGPRLRLTTNRAEDLSPTWSPDGSHIAFLRVATNETAIFVSPSEGGVHRKVADVYPTRLEAVGKHLDWSPSGRYLAAADKHSPEEPFSIVLIDVITGEKKQLTSPPGIIGDSAPAFSPDGQTVAFIRAVSSGVDDIFVVPASGGEPRPVTNDRRYITSLGWSPDGRTILFSSDRAGNPTLWRIPVSGGTPARLSAVGENAAYPVFARSKRRLAYSNFYEDTNIWRMDTATGEIEKVISSTQYDSSPQFSPDGSRVAFRSSRSGFHEIWLADAAGGGERQLTYFSGRLTGTPRWSPDGQSIVFDARPEGLPDIYAIDVNTGDKKRITSEKSEDVVPSWSRDGKWIYFASNRTLSWQVWKAPVDGGPPVQVTRNGGFAAFESEDGYVYYAKGRSVPGLWRVPLRGGEEEPVLERLKSGYWGYWGLCERGIVFADRESSQVPPALYLYDPKTRRTSRLGNASRPFIVGDSALTVLPDCSQVLYTQVDQRGSDIMLVDNYPVIR